MLTREWLVYVIAGSAIIFKVESSAYGDFPRVKFDVGMTVECREVPGTVSQETNTKVVEAVIPITIELLAGKEVDVDSAEVRIDTHKQATIVGFLPKTGLHSEHNGPVVISITTGKGSASVGYSISPGRGKVGAHGDFNISTTTYELLPPQQVVLASGTSERNSTAFFKLQPANGFTIQQQRNYSVLLEVPLGWEGDFVVINSKCQARDVGRVFTDEAKILDGYFAVGLYLKGSKKAKALADQIGDIERRLGFIDWNNRFKPVLTYKSWYSWIFGNSQALTEEQFDEMMRGLDTFQLGEREVRLACSLVRSGSEPTALRMVQERALVSLGSVSFSSTLGQMVSDKVVKMFSEEAPDNKELSGMPNLEKKGRIRVPLAKLRSLNGSKHD